MLTMHEWRSRYEIYVNRSSNLENCESPRTRMAPVRRPVCVTEVEIHRTSPEAVRRRGRRR